MRNAKRFGGWELAAGCLTLVVLAAAAYTTSQAVAPQAAMAQDEGAGEAPAAEGASAEAIALAEEAKKKSMLRWFYDALGIRYVIAFLALSFSFIGVMVMCILMARRDNIVPVQLVESFEAHLNEKRYQEAYELAKADDSFLGQVLAGLFKLKEGYAQAIEAMQEVGEEENMKLEHRLSYIALIGTISPMVGLLGTVDGMVASFTVIATSVTAPPPAKLAEGISMALVTTLVGLWLAIPAILAYNLLKNRLARLVLEAGIVSEGLMSRFQNVGGGKKVG